MGAVSAAGSFRCALLLAALVTAGSPAAQATAPPCPVAPLAELDVGNGSSVAIAAQGDLLIVSTSGTGGQPEPAVAVLRRNTDGWWSLEATLHAGDAAPGALFGSAVALDGERIAIGAPGDGDLAGAVYIFTDSRAGWIEEQKITQAPPVPGARFGSAVDLAGDLLAAGAPGHGAAAPGGGAVLLVQRDPGGAWAPQALLTADDAGTGHRLGSSLSIDGGRVLAGAPFAGDAGEGAAYLFDLASGAQLARLTASGAVPGSLFGAAVALHGATALIGAPQHSAAALAAGAAWILEERAGVWNAAPMLELDDPAAFDLFGSAVALDGSGAWVSAPYREGRGSVFEYRRDQGAWESHLELTRGGDGDETTGGAIARTGNLLIASAGGDGPDAAVYLVDECIVEGVPGQCSAAVPQTTLPALHVGPDTVAVSERIFAAGGRADTNEGQDGGVVARVRADDGTWGPSRMLVGSDTVEGDDFGAALDADGDRLLIGAPQRTPPGSTCDEGGAYLFERQGDALVQTLLIEPPDAGSCRRFGTAIALDGQRAAIGATGSSLHGSTGAICIYGISGENWTLEAILTLPDGHPFDCFGCAVAMDGDYVLAGDLSASLFQLKGEGWVEVARLEAATPAQGAAFARAVDISLPRLAIGSSGFVTIFTGEGGAWTPTDVVTHPAATSAFGRSVALDGDRLLVAWPTHGKALLYGGGAEGWTLLTSLLTSPIGGVNGAVDLFGAAAAVTGNENLSAALYETASLDCNGNDLADACEIAAGLVADLDMNGVPDVCEAPPGDIDGDGVAGIDDLVALVVAWGPCPAAPADCPGDIDGNGAVDVNDLLILLLTWSA